ncbi:MAG: TonB-dependent receptor, partial [Pseudomonadales bacterium]
SRIRDANMISASPITTITDEEFDLAGTTRVEDLLNTFPQIAPSFDSFTVNPTTGFATADLYGLGTQRTLVLVNGHRMQAGGIRSQARDLNQIPAALVKRVEVLTGGASAVYGSDAVAGVVNFILDTNFEGVSFSGGYSGYSHENDNEYIQGLMDTSGFTYPTGGSGFGGEAYNFELALGAPIADGDGHAMAYFTWRENDPLLQGERDYSSCALSAAGTSCGGSSTAPDPNFFLVYFDPNDSADNFIGFANQADDGSWLPGVGQLYNYAPINHFQRPDERWTLGGAISLEISPQFQPYLETMVANTNTRVQIAQSGTFFVNFFEFADGDPLIGSMFADLGLDPAADVGVYIGKRNVEGGPRISAIESTSFRAVAGARGMINDDWDYDISYVFGRSASSEANINDFLVSRIEGAVLACADPALVGTDACYNVFTPNGVTAGAAGALGGTGMRDHSSQLTSVGGYVTGILPFTVPSASEPVSLVAGVEYRKDEYVVDTDANMEAGNFAGAGGPRLPIAGSFSVNEIYFEAGVPIYDGGDVLQTLNLDLGYRYSDYDTSGGASTFKIGASAQVTDMVRLRGGFNRAIRAANVGELFADQQIALWSGEDPCAGAAPTFTAAQCANTGVSAAQYGTIVASPANQYNQFIGGNTALAPEEADTFTLGFVATPLDSLSVSVDYYDIEITERVGTIGANTILRFCGQTGDPFLCDRVKRNASTGDLWLGSDPAVSGQIENLNANFGDLHFRGVNLNATYNMPLFAGNLTASLAGTYALENEIAPLPGVNPAATFDCVGVINTTCNFPQTPEWRHTARVTYAQDRFSGSLRWRYVGELDYVNTDGTIGSTDQLLINNGHKVSAVNYIDLTGTVDVMENVNLIVGMNNVFDREPPMVGGGLILNANSIGGYDQLGRYLHVTFNLRY